jgi:hypothetical protein
LGKKVVQLLLCILHPVAAVLIWYHLALRSHDWAFTRMGWAVVVIIPLVPFIHVLTGNDFIYFGRAPGSPWKPEFRRAD